MSVNLYLNVLLNIYVLVEYVVYAIDYEAAVWNGGFKYMSMAWLLMKRTSQWFKATSNWGHTRTRQFRRV